MNNMFDDCGKLKSLILSPTFRTNNVENMCCMFSDCSSLINLDISFFNFRSISDIRDMFSGCSNELKNKVREQNYKIKKKAFIY